MTDGIFAMFQAASGDNDPIHYNLEYCQDRGHRDMLAHGMQTFIQTAAGAGTFPSQVADSLVGLIEFGGNILKPVYRNDTLYAKLEITDLIEQNTTGIIVMTASVENHQGIEVLSGFHKYLIRKRPDQA
ncbi:MaoC family dehydratase [Paracoccus saliphilus]|nr:MaoC family dehydratase [Paracoccus saliphilus]